MIEVLLVIEDQLEGVDPTKSVGVDPINVSIIIGDHLTTEEIPTKFHQVENYL